MNCALNILQRLPYFLQVVCLVVLLSGSLSLAQKGRGDEPISEELHQLLDARIEAIGKERGSKRVDEWAGTYFDGDHHATVIHWAPESGFAVTASHHTFYPTWVNYGKVKYEIGRLTLFPELKKGQPNAYGIASEFVAVRWDQWHILVPPDQLLQFAYAVHSNSDSEIWSYFVKAGDSGKSRKGLPTLPSEYLKFMKMPAIQSRIIEVRSNPNNPWDSEVVLNVGARHRVIEGMQFYFVSRSGLHVRLRVDRVEHERSYGFQSMLGSSSEASERETGFKIGWKFSSKMPRGFIEP